MKKTNLMFAAFLFVAVCVGFASCDDDSASSTVTAGDFVDLGLSVKWASCNVGASLPEGYGDFYTYDEAMTSFEGLKKTKYHTSGLYLGIVGFNNSLYQYTYDSYDFRLLRSASKSAFQGFVNGLKIDDGTTLYYAVDEAVSKLENSVFPDDLTKVAIVTFTDGLDVGSVEYADKHESVSAVSQHLKSARVNGKSVDAYAIGLRGNDVTNISRFRENLTALSSSASNAMEVSDMSEVNAKFQEIANSLYNETKTLSVTIVTPGLTNGQKLRFTFDGNLSSATSSECYMEGVWDRTNNRLTSVTYVGMKSGSGSSVSLTKTESIFYAFTLEDVVRTDGNDFAMSKVQMWLEDGGLWAKNSEFDPEDSEDPVVEQKSAVIMLVLDCSSSLGTTGLSQIKTAANNFISTLASSVGNSSSSEGEVSTIYVSNGNTSRLPTKAEMQELIDNCSWDYGTSGYIVTGPNGNSIFLPAAGYRYGSDVYRVQDSGFYWSATEYDSDDANYLYFDSSEVRMNSSDRCCGFSVRLVQN